MRHPNQFEEADLAELVGAEKAALYYPHLLEGFRTYGLINARRQAHFLAQALAETGGFSHLEESLSYSPLRLTQVWPGRFPTIAAAEPYAFAPEKLANLVYANRMGNGGPESGDGWRYRGRGLIQLTGRNNYVGATLSLNARFEGAPDLISFPERLLEPRWAAISACDYWARARYMGLSLSWWADRNSLEMVTRGVNGGLIGLNLRAAWLAKAQVVLAKGAV